MAQYKNVKTGLVWDIADPAMLKMVKADSDTFQPVEKMTAAQKKAAEEAAKKITGDAEGNKDVNADEAAGQAENKA